MKELLVVGNKDLMGFSMRRRQWCPVIVEAVDEANVSLLVCALWVREW